MNWGTAAAILVVAGILEQIFVELLRSIVDRRRRDRDGMGGTQDIAIIGMMIGWLLVIGALICGGVWLIKR